MKMTSLLPAVRTADIAAASTDTLRTELARGLTLTAEVLTRLSMVWAELGRRGEDLSDLRHGLARTLPLIAAGRLAAEAVVAFSGRPAVLRALEGVPLEQQRRLAGGEPLRVIDVEKSGSVLDMPLATLPAAALRVVFGDGEVRTPEQQRLAFRPRARKQREEEPGYRYRPRYDPAAGTIAVGRMTVQLADLLHELASAAGPDRLALDVPEEYVTLKVRLGLDEMERFQALCRKGGLPDWEMARKALRAFGLI